MLPHGLAFIHLNGYFCKSILAYQTSGGSMRDLVS